MPGCPEFGQRVSSGSTRSAPCLMTIGARPVNAAVTASDNFEAERRMVDWLTALPCHQGADDSATHDADRWTDAHN